VHRRADDQHRVDRAGDLRHPHRTAGRLPPLRRIAGGGRVRLYACGHDRRDVDVVVTFRYDGGVVHVRRGPHDRRDVGADARLIAHVIVVRLLSTVENGAGSHVMAAALAALMVDEMADVPGLSTVSHRCAQRQVRAAQIGDDEAAVPSNHRCRKRGENFPGHGVGHYRSTLAGAVA
jgi:hypothetical protein